MYGHGFVRFLRAIQFSFESFFLSELLLYKLFRNIHTDIGVNIEIIIHNWRNHRYRAWHVNRIPLGPDTNEEDHDTHQDEVVHENDMDEWEMLSCLVPPNTIQVSDIETLGRRDFDLVHPWNSTIGESNNL